MFFSFRQSQFKSQLVNTTLAHINTNFLSGNTPYTFNTGETLSLGEEHLPKNKVLDDERRLYIWASRIVRYFKAGYEVKNNNSKNNTAGLIAEFLKNIPELDERTKKFLCTDVNALNCLILTLLMSKNQNDWDSTLELIKHYDVLPQSILLQLEWYYEFVFQVTSISSKRLIQILDEQKNSAQASSSLMNTTTQPIFQVIQFIILAQHYLQDPQSNFSTLPSSVQALVNNQPHKLNQLAAMITQGIIATQFSPHPLIHDQLSTLKEIFRVRFHMLERELASNKTVLKSSTDRAFLEYFIYDSLQHLKEIEQAEQLIGLSQMIRFHSPKTGEFYKKIHANGCILVQKFFETEKYTEAYLLHDELIQFVAHTDQPLIHARIALYCVCSRLEQWLLGTTSTVVFHPLEEPYLAQFKKSKLDFKMPELAVNQLFILAKKIAQYCLKTQDRTIQEQCKSNYCLIEKYLTHKQRKAIKKILESAELKDIDVVEKIGSLTVNKNQNSESTTIKKAPSLTQQEQSEVHKTLPPTLINKSQKKAKMTSASVLLTSEHPAAPTTSKPVIEQKPTAVETSTTPQQYSESIETTPEVIVQQDKTTSITAQLLPYSPSKIVLPDAIGLPTTKNIKKQKITSTTTPDTLPLDHTVPQAKRSVATPFKKESAKNIVSTSSQTEKISEKSSVKQKSVVPPSAKISAKRIFPSQQQTSVKQVNAPLASDFITTTSTIDTSLVAQSQTSIRFNEKKPKTTTAKNTPLKKELSAYSLFNKQTSVLCITRQQIPLELLLLIDELRKEFAEATFYLTGAAPGNLLEGKKPNDYDFLVVNVSLFAIKKALEKKQIQSEQRSPKYPILYCQLTSEISIDFSASFLRSGQNKHELLELDYSKRDFNVSALYIEFTKNAQFPVFSFANALEKRANKKIADVLDVPIESLKHDPTRLFRLAKILINYSDYTLDVNLKNALQKLQPQWFTIFNTYLQQDPGNKFRLDHAIRKLFLRYKFEEINTVFNRLGILTLFTGNSKTLSNIACARLPKSLNKEHYYFGWLLANYLQHFEEKKRMFAPFMDYLVPTLSEVPCLQFVFYANNSCLPSMEPTLRELCQEFQLIDSSSQHSLN